MMFEPPIYIENPSKLELIGRLQQFLAEKDAKAFKVGLTHEGKFINRYSQFDRFKKLLSSSIFCRTIDWKVALSVEEEMKLILKERNICCNNVNDTPGNLKDGKIYIVYMTEAKTKDCRCEICCNVWIEGVDKRKNHFKMKHPQLVKDFKTTIAELQNRHDDNDKELIEMCQGIINWAK